jgi:O-antigen/teichoic acid export membrane protein
MSKNNSRTKNSVLNVATSIGGQLLLSILRFVTRTVFIQTLGKSYLGINGLFSDILSMLSLTELGMDTAINFQLYKPLAEHDDHRVRVLMKFYRQAYFAIGTVILILGICLIPLLPRLIRDYDSLAAMHINAVVIFVLYLLKSVSSYWFFAYRSAVMRANQKKYILDVVDYAVTIIANIAEILVLVWLRDFMVYTALALAFTVIQNLVNAKISERYYPQFFEKEPDSLPKEEVIGLFKDCGALFTYKANSVVLKATDNIVLSSFVGLTIVGLYSNYLLFFATIRNFLVRIYTAVNASMGNLFATESLVKKYQFFQIMNFLTVLLYGTAGVGVAVCGDELIRVWVSDSYVIPQPFSILIGVEILLNGLQSNLGQIRNVSGVFRQLWYRPILGIIINIVVSVGLVQVCGIYGVIIGTLVSLVLTIFLVDPWVIHKYSFQNYKPVSEYYKKNLIYFVILAVLCAADMWLCGVFFVGHGWFSVIVHVIIVSTTVPGVFVLLFWNSHECKYLVQLTKRILGKVLKRIGRRASA